MVYWQVFKKSYNRNLQYRLSHVINNIASAIFGFVSIAIWEGVLEGKDGRSAYDVTDMTHYVIFSQCILWVTTFLTNGLGIDVGIRSGSVSLELMRPVSFYMYTLSQEAGRLAYNLFFRSFPIGVILALAAGFYVPHNISTYFFAVLSLLLAVILSLNIFYFIGVSAFWTTEINWANTVNYTLYFSLGGQMVPLDILPGILGKITMFLPFAGVIYFPTMIYLERTGYYGIVLQIFWIAVLTAINAWLTRQARNRMEIQGG